MTRINLILFGFKGCGKTHFGKRLAERMNRPFVDTDTLLAKKYAEETGQSLSVREIYRALGEEGFRALEMKAISDLSECKSIIVSLGGGAVLHPQNVEELQKIGRLVYLKAGWDTLRRRILLTELPAFLKGKEDFETMYKERLPIYESIRASKIDVDLLDEPAVLAALRNLVILDDP